MTRRSNLLCALVLITGAEAFALLGEHPDAPVSSSQWPEGWAELVNQPSRVYGYFLNWSDQFYFAGDTTACNEFLNHYAALAKRSELVTISSGPGSVAPHLRKETLQYDWELGLTGGSHINVKILPGGKVKLCELIVPVTLQVQESSALDSFRLDTGSDAERLKQEIAQFVLAHEKKRRAAKTVKED